MQKVYAQLTLNIVFVEGKMRIFARWLLPGIHHFHLARKFRRVLLFIEDSQCKMGVAINGGTPKSSISVDLPSVLGYHHSRNPPNRSIAISGPDLLKVPAILYRLYKGSVEAIPTKYGPKNGTAPRILNISRTTVFVEFHCEFHVPRILG